MIDLTMTIKDQMAVYPGDPNMRLKVINEIAKDGFQNEVLITNMHVGTHIDGFGHMLENKPSIASYPIETFIGVARLIDNELSYIKGDEDMLLIDLKGESLNKDLCDLVIKHNIHLIGVNMDSIEHAPYLMHKQLFNHQVFIVENLINFEKLEKNKLYKLFVIPLKIDASSSLCRVFVE